MKKKLLFCFMFVCSIACALGLFANFFTSTYAFSAYDVSNLPSSPFEFISFSQSGHIFTEDDFVETEVNGKTYYVLYTNKTVTISFNYEQETQGHQNFFNLSMSETIENNTYSIDTLKYFTYSYPTIDPETNEPIVETAENPYGNPYYVFDPSKVNDFYSTFYEEHSATYTAGTYDYYSFTLTAELSHTIRVNYRDQWTRKSDYSLPIVIVNSEHNFSAGNLCLWEYKAGNNYESVTTPTDGMTYAPVTLFTPNGSEHNPIYIDFEYRGEQYSVYNIDGNYYNAYDDSLIDTSALRQSSLNTTGKYGLYFNRSGTYNVRIYDNSYLCYQQGNYYENYFIIENSSDSFYLSAVTVNNDALAFGQITNDSVVVEFANIWTVFNYVTDIKVDENFRHSIDENINTTVTFSKHDVRDDFGSKIKFEEDGRYHVYVNARYCEDHDTLVSDNDRSHRNCAHVREDYLLAECQFRIICDIRSYFIIGTNPPSIYEVTEKDKANQTTTYTHNDSIARSYNDQIYGTTDYSVIITVARSAPSIAGISNNERTSSDVSLTVYGVGDITVTITGQGEPTPVVYKSGDTLPKFTEEGSYTVEITDQMGSTVTKNFTITPQMNAAAIALIIIGLVIILVCIVAIIISRAKIKVR